MEMDFKVRAYGRTELALAYCPTITPKAALRKLNRWIALVPDLESRLKALGFIPSSRSYTPAEVAIIVEALGQP